ncbi:TonB-dependent receptor [Cetobacterium ceti]
MKKSILLGAFIVTATMVLGKEDGNFVKLEDTVITTENFETTVRDTPSNISIVTSDEIEKSGAKNLVDALRNVPGLYTREYQGGEVRFDLRGQNPMYANKNVIVTVDGVPVNRVGLSGTDSYNLSQIPMDRIARIEVIPGGGSVLYGDGSIGGIVNIKTKSVQDKKDYGSVNVNVGSHKLFSENITYGTKIGDRFLNEISFTKYNSHGDGRRLDSDGTRENINRYSGTYTGKYLLDKGDIEFKYTHSKSAKRLGSTIPDRIYNDSIKRTTKLGKNKNELNDFYLKYRTEITDNLESLTYINYTHNDYTPYSTYYPGPIGQWIDGSVKGEKGYIENKSKERKRYVKTQLKYKYGKENYAIFGADWSKHEERDDSPFVKEKEVTKYLLDKGLNAEKDAYGFFLMNKINYGKFQFNQGVRREYTSYNYYYQKLTGVNLENKWYTTDKQKFKNTGAELSANYLYSDTGSTYITYTRGFRTPTAIEIGSFEGKRESQVDNTVAIGMKDFISNTYISSSIFYTKSDNYMYGKIPSNPDDWEKSITANIGKVDKYGIDLNGEHYIGDLTLRGGISYLHHEIKSGKSKGEKLPSVPNWKLTAGATYNVTPKFSVSADALYNGSYTVLDALKYVDTSALPSKPNPESSLLKYKEKVKSYITLDLSSAYDFGNGLLVTFRIDNVFDEKYDNYTGAWGDYGGVNQYVVQQHLPAPGRTYTMGLTYKF